MQYSPAVPARTSRSPLVVSTTSLYAAFEHMPDPRRRQGMRYPLPAVLTLAVAAILSNQLSVLAIAEWGAVQPKKLKRALGFVHDRTPHQTTLHRIFRRLDPAALEGILTRFFDPSLPGELPARGSQGVALDGKAQRGRLQGSAEPLHPVHAVSAFCHDVGVVLAQIAVDSQHHEGELSVAPTLIKHLAWQGRVLTGDALFCQRNLCAQVVEAGGDYLVVVKANQPRLQADIALLFAPPSREEVGRQRGQAPVPIEERTVRRVNKGHGRLEVRHLRASTELADYVDWPYLAQVFELRRTWDQNGETKQAVQFGITSLPPAVANAERLLALKRGHWSIENQLHYVKDVTLREDHSLIRQGTGPHVMAALRNTAISLLRRAGYRTIASRLRYHSQRPEAALALLGIPIIENA